LKRPVVADPNEVHITRIAGIVFATRFSFAVFCDEKLLEAFGYGTALIILQFVLAAKRYLFETGTAETERCFKFMVGNHSFVGERLDLMLSAGKACVSGGGKELFHLFERHSVLCFFPKWLGCQGCAGEEKSQKELFHG
jgi:hypothetical protein